MTSKREKEPALPESVMIFGCGYVGTALAKALIARGVRVGALTRNVDRAKVLSEIGVSEVIEAELNLPYWQSQLKDAYGSVVNCVSSAGGGIDGYRKSYVEGQQRILEWAESQSLANFIYTSSTSVYPQDNGVVVNECADTSDAPATGQVILESERMIEVNAQLFESWYVLRLAGIYGPGRHYLLNQLRKGEGMIPGSGDHRMNMIHCEDIVQVIIAALTNDSPSGIYNVCDDFPETKEAVLRYLATCLDLPVPTFDLSNISPRLKRRGGRMPDRVISSAKLKSLLSWRPIYPSYREGYASILSE